MKSQREPQIETDTDIKDIVKDITDQYPEMEGVIQHLSIETNRLFDFKGYFADLESLGIPAENIRTSFCG